MKKKFLVLAPFVLALASIASSQSIIITGGGGGVGAGDNTTFTGNNTFSGSNVVSGRWVFGTALDAAFGVEFNLTTGSVCWEGALADTAEACLSHTVNSGFDTTTTIPAAATSQTIGILEANQTFTAVNTFSGTLRATGAAGFQPAGGSSNGSIVNNVAQTPDKAWIATGVTANAWTIAEIADAASDLQNCDCGTSACTDPHLNVHSSNASASECVSISHNGTQPQIRTVTTSSGRPVGLHGGTAVASAATITPTGNVFHVTGTTNIDNVTIMATGTLITLIFDGVLTVGDLSGNINLSAAFASTANDTLTLASDGTTWFEVGRSVN